MCVQRDEIGVEKSRQLMPHRQLNIKRFKEDRKPGGVHDMVECQEKESSLGGDLY